jgi:hypothetical protein
LREGSATEALDDLLRKARDEAILDADAGKARFLQTMIQETLLEIGNRRPFVPNVLRLNCGDVVQIDKPEHCLITEDGETLVFNERGGKLKFIAVANIALVE